MSYLLRTAPQIITSAFAENRYAFSNNTSRQTGSLSRLNLQAVIPAKAGIQIPKNGFRIKTCPERSRMGAV
jgi:hypothetical protein